MISTKELLSILKEKDEAFAIERANWTKERADLLNRIKPEAWQPVPGAEEFFAPPAKDMFDDTTYEPDYDPSNTEIRDLMTEALDTGVTE